jgi:hypothetical protein
MMKLSIFFSIALILCLNQGVTMASQLESVERSLGKLNISIDPRMELLASVRFFSKYPRINRDLPYSNEILFYFEPFKRHSATRFIYSFGLRGFTYDAPVAFMLHLSQPPELKLKYELTDYLISRADILARRGRGRNNLERYRTELKSFAEVSNFEAFWNSKIPFYNQILDLIIAEIEVRNIDFVKTMEDYFNETKDSYNIIITPTFQHGKGFSITDAEGNVKIYACISTTETKNGIPYLTSWQLLNLVWHEFGHSFVNPLTDKHADKVATSARLFNPIRKQMRRQAYTCWRRVVNEHIIRAIEVRLMELHLSSRHANLILEHNLKLDFIYIEPLVEKLKEFEKLRDETGITFSEFYPELLNVFSNL